MEESKIKNVRRLMEGDSSLFMVEQTAVHCKLYQLIIKSPSL